MTSASFPYAVTRTCGSGKLCADSKSGVLSVLFPPMNLSLSNVFALLEGSPAPFFSASPDRFVLQDLSALD